MERLTIKSPKSDMVWFNGNTNWQEPCEMGAHEVGKVLRKLAEYEDTGYTPQEVKSIMQLAEKMNVCDLVAENLKARNRIRHFEADISITGNKAARIREHAAKLMELEEQGLLLRLSPNYLETIKLLTVAAIAYQENQNIITSQMKDNKEIADLFMNLPTVQGTSNHFKLLNLVESDIDINKITNIQQIVDILYPKER